MTKPIISHNFVHVKPEVEDKNFLIDQDLIGRKV